MGEGIETPYTKQGLIHPSEGSRAPRSTSTVPAGWGCLDEIATSKGFRWIRWLDGIQRGRREQTYPTVSPMPFCFSTLISNDNSPVFVSNRMLHQFRLPMMNFPFDGVPSVSWTKIGSYSRI